MKFNKKIEFEAAKYHTNATHINNNNHQNAPNDHVKSEPPLKCQDDLWMPAGQAGTFNRIRNDFSLNIGSDNEPDYGKVYSDDAHWSSDKKQTVKKIRFRICTLALLGLAFALMSRLILNVSIVEMVRNKPIQVIENSVDHAEVMTTSQASIADDLAEKTTDNIFDIITNEEEENNNAEFMKTNQSDNFEQTHGQELPDDGLHFDWSKRQQNLILGSMYLGYVPGILLSGQIVQNYGAKMPLFVCLFGTSIINVLTPTFARLSPNLLIGSRVTLGLIQGSIFPALYELFNRWLTATESSIFAPMLKVSMPLGSVIGTLMPGLLASLGLEWPYLFYIAGVLCMVWSMVWLYFATSTPQTNSYVEENELNRIMRKKLMQQQQLDEKNKTTDTPAVPWLLIISCPSVLALAVVKYTYNLGMDFVYLELAVYLRGAHGAPIESISAIASTCYCMQMCLITSIGWLAKVVVNNRTFGFSVTKWRKVFQGGSNFLMAIMYLVLALSEPSIELASMLLIAVCLSWMLGAGGESMVPYDLSSKYTASIVGLTHSLSLFSGLTVPFVFDMIVGEEVQAPDRWRLLFTLLSGALALGGLVFVLLLKAKPFLPEEKALATKQQASGGETKLGPPKS